MITTNAVPEAMAGKQTIQHKPVQCSNLMKGNRLQNNKKKIDLLGFGGPSAEKMVGIRSRQAAKQLDQLMHDHGAVVGITGQRCDHVIHAFDDVNS